MMKISSINAFKKLKSCLPAHHHHHHKDNALIIPKTLSQQTTLIGSSPSVYPSSTFPPSSSLTRGFLSSTSTIIPPVVNLESPAKKRKRDCIKRALMIKSKGPEKKSFFSKALKSRTTVAESSVIEGLVEQNESTLPVKPLNPDFETQPLQDVQNADVKEKCSFYETGTDNSSIVDDASFQDTLKLKRVQSNSSSSSSIDSELEDLIKLSKSLYDKLTAELNEESNDFEIGPLQKPFYNAGYLNTTAAKVGVPIKIADTSRNISVDVEMCKKSKKRQYFSKHCSKLLSKLRTIIPKKRVIQLKKYDSIVSFSSDSTVSISSDSTVSISSDSIGTISSHSIASSSSDSTVSISDSIGSFSSDSCYNSSLSHDDMNETTFSFISATSSTDNSEDDFQVIYHIPSRNVAIKKDGKFEMMQFPQFLNYLKECDDYHMSQGNINHVRIEDLVELQKYADNFQEEDLQLHKDLELSKPSEADTNDVDIDICNGPILFFEGKGDKYFILKGSEVVQMAGPKFRTFYINHSPRCVKLTRDNICNYPIPKEIVKDKILPNLEEPCDYLKTLRSSSSSLSLYQCAQLFKVEEEEEEEEEEEDFDCEETDERSFTISLSTIEEEEEESYNYGGLTLSMLKNL